MSLLPSVTLETIRLWAYNPEAYFKAHGEEVLLQEVQWVPTLLALAGDPACPRQHKIETILEKFIRHSFLERKSATLQAIHYILEEKSALLTTQWLVLLMITFNYLYGIFLERQRITEAACDKIAKELLQGSEKEANFAKEDSLADETRVYASALNSLKQYLYINPATGEWKTSKYLRWKSFSDATN